MIAARPVGAGGLTGVQAALWRPVNRRAFQRSLLRYKIEAQLNNSQITHPRLLEMLTQLNPAADAPFPRSRATLGKWMTQAYEQMKTVRFYPITLLSNCTNSN